MKIIWSHLLCFLIFATINAQETAKDKIPAFKLLRAEEDYSELKNQKGLRKGLNTLKYMPLGKSGNSFISMGGQYRPRFEHYTNRFWLTDQDQNFYSHRIALHAKLTVGKSLSFFTELYHGYTNPNKEFAEFDKADVFQAFVEFKVPNKKNVRLNFRVGRQEMGLGAARLVGIREGPNIRRSFDIVKVLFTKNGGRVQGFYGKEVIPGFEAFDNKLYFFTSGSAQPRLWGLDADFKIKGVTGRNELYYLGFQVDNAQFNDVSGQETRHTLGLRRYGKIGKHWRYNSEIIYQFGRLASADISAFSIDTDWHYEWLETKRQWKLGLKLEYSSGDKEADDGKVNSFNPMFVNPAFYSLAATITPVNLIGVHPSVSFRATDKFRLYFEWAVFWKASENDALYRPTRFINIPANDNTNRGLGNQFGSKMKYEFSSNLSFDLDISYFIAGKFQKQSGAKGNILHLAPTLNYRF